MQKIALITVALLCLASPASAGLLEWSGTLDVDLGEASLLSAEGSGTATVNGSAFGSHLNTLAIDGGISGTGSGVEPGMPPIITNIEITATLGSGVISGISGGPPAGGPLPIGGLLRFCLVNSGCAQNFTVPLQSGGDGFGNGTAPPPIAGGAGSLRVSFEHAPFTLGTAAAQTQTDNGDITTVTLMGFVHGPGSGTSSTALTSGVIRLVTPTQVTTDGFPGNNEKLAMFGTLTIHFIPEPGLLLLLGSGVVGLALLGRARMKR